MTELSGSKKKLLAFSLRRKGYSLNEVANQVGIAKSTASVWFRDISLSKAARHRLANLTLQAREKAFQALTSKRGLMIRQIEEKVRSMLIGLDLKSQQFSKTLCAFLYWGEGGKVDHHVSFINSDPQMIAAFLTLFRRSFVTDERKFRALVHIHEYHHNEQIKKYWSKITSIPLSQFTKSYLKPHTGKTIRPGFMGTIKIKYYDSKIAHELKAIYNTVACTLGT